MASVAGLSAGAARPTPVTVDPPISLGQFVKLAGLAATGGEAKRLVAAGWVMLNGAVETRRGRKLKSGDIVHSRGMAAEVVWRPAGGGPAAVALEGEESPDTSLPGGSGLVSASVE